MKLFKLDFHLHRVVVGKDKAFIKGAYGKQLDIGRNDETVDKIVLGASLSAS